MQISIMTAHKKIHTISVIELENLTLIGLKRNKVEIVTVLMMRSGGEYHSRWFAYPSNPK